MAAKWINRSSLQGRAVVLVCLALGLAGITARGLDGNQPGGMAHMPGHMYMTVLRSPQPEDQQKAEAVAAADRKRLWRPMRITTRRWRMVIGSFFPMSRNPNITSPKPSTVWRLDRTSIPIRPTSLLYKKTADGGYKLVGAMYTDRVDATEDELNDRIPAQHCALAPARKFLVRRQQDKRLRTLARMRTSAWKG